MALPTALLEAIAAAEGRRVVIVIGAGCSLEPPTNLPLADACSKEAHRRLVDDKVLTGGECANPSDLSALADAVVERTGSQRELVNRLPTTRFKTATPNDGHYLTAALMLEGAISHAITINFDLALSHALSQVAAGDLVSIIRGPEEHAQVSGCNLIYLHRNADSDPEAWILTNAAIQQAWQERWEELIGGLVAVGPVIVFAGLGSSCGVLRHSVAKMRTALGEMARAFLVDPGNLEHSQFAAEVNCTPETHISMGWVEFMRSLSDRRTREIVSGISRACNELSRREDWPVENVDTLCAQLLALNLLSFGKLRAAWLLDKRPYVRMEQDHALLIADLLLALGFLQRVENLRVSLRQDGLVDIRLDQRHVQVRLASGKGVRRWASVEAELRQLEKYGPAESRAIRVRTTIVGGVVGNRAGNITAPPSIIATEDENGLIDGDTRFGLYSIDEIRNDPRIFMQVLQ
jgi:hypothetical protein